MTSSHSAQSEGPSGYREAVELEFVEATKVYPGADANFTLFSDDGNTYAYEKGDGSVTHLHWNDATRQMTHEGPAEWSGPDNTIVKIFGPTAEVIAH